VISRASNAHGKYMEIRVVGLAAVILILFLYLPVLKYLAKKDSDQTIDFHRFR